MTERIVVIGAGMVGHRFVEQMAGTDADVTLIGEEEYEPYNRILLSDVLAGRTELSALTLPGVADGVTFARGVAAVEIDREDRVVHLDDGGTVAYDRLVLATGARAFVPPIDGLAARPKHVHVLRSIDDCRDLTARAMNAKHAVVLGGGLLGLEAACGLRRRGVPVTVVENADRPMATQLGPEPGVALRTALGSVGVDVRTGSGIAEVVSAYGEIVAVRLVDDTLLAADLLVVSCGIRAETTLAQRAGLAVDRGIVVDEHHATSDPQVFAIGDCAQGPAPMTGLLAPGWRQAERLAAHLQGAVAPPIAHVPEPVRLKAAGVDLVVAGSVTDGDRVLTVHDPDGGRHVRLVVRGERLVGLTCIGMPAVSPGLVVALERGTPISVDPLTLLLPAAPAEAASPMAMPGDTTICRCNTVTKRDIVHAWEDGADSVEKVAAQTRATTGCGGCSDAVCGLVDWLNASDPATPAPVSQAVSQAAPKQDALPVAWP